MSCQQLEKFLLLIVHSVPFPFGPSNPWAPHQTPLLQIINKLMVNEI